MLYVGVTGNIGRRIHEHKSHATQGFTGKYRVTRLVHLEHTDDVLAAITREKQIKGWRRAKKIALIATGNPAWDDLAADWFGTGDVVDSILG